MKTKLLCQCGPAKDKFSLSILSILLKDNKDFLIGAGDGTISFVRGDGFKRVK